MLDVIKIKNCISHAVAKKIFFAFAALQTHNKCGSIFVKREKISATAVTARQSLGRSAIFSLVLVVGVEPTRCCHLRILSPVRLPFRHTSILNCRAVETKVINFVYAQDFKPCASITPKILANFWGPRATDHPKIFVSFWGPRAADRPKTFTSFWTAFLS